VETWKHGNVETWTPPKIEEIAETRKLRKRRGKCVNKIE
jgi:hypothetical protein